MFTVDEGGTGQKLAAAAAGGGHGREARKNEHVGALGLLKSADLFSSVYQKKEKGGDRDECMHTNVATPEEMQDDVKMDGGRQAYE